MTRGRVTTVAAAALAVTAALVSGCSFAGSAGVPAAAGTPTGASAVGTGPAGTSGPSSSPPAAAAGTHSPAGTHSAAAGTTSRAAGTSSAGAGPTSAADPGVDRCRTGGLTAALVPGSPGAGQREATLVLRNTGGRPCTVLGFGGIGLYDAAGRPVPTNQVRVTPPSPAAVTLAPGGSATSQLRWSAVAGRGDSASGTCQPVAATLRVIPPDETTALPVRWDGGPVCEGGTVQQQAYVAG